MVGQFLFEGMFHWSIWLGQKYLDFVKRRKCTSTFKCKTAMLDLDFVIKARGYMGYLDIKHSCLVNNDHSKWGCENSMRKVKEEI